VNILLLSAGGGGGNILRSLKKLFRRDVTVSQKINPKFAARLERSVVTRFLDTNEFSLTDVPKEERLLIGRQTTRRLGSMHDPALAKAALEESQGEVEALLARHSVIILIGTGGKGTGSGTMLPLAQMARRLRKLVIPVFVRPSFERHEVEKPRYDQALNVVRGFDATGIRLMEMLNDCGYVERDPQPQSVVWERMNLPIARGLRGLLYVLADLSQVDPSDLSLLFAGPGRLRIAFAEVDPLPGREPGDHDIQKAVQACWENSYYAFDQPVGTSLVCIQGDWSNVVDGKIKSQIAALALDGTAHSYYNPLYARAFHMPRPWGVTSVFAEYTGRHQPLDIEWPSQQRSAAFSIEAVARRPAVAIVTVRDEAPVDVPEDEELTPHEDAPAIKEREPAHEGARPAFARLYELALALQRSDAEAVAIASQPDAGGIAMEAAEIRKLLGTMWFPSVFHRFSRGWRDRLLDVLMEDVTVPNHVLKVGRGRMALSEISLESLKDLIRKTYFPDTIQPDLLFLVGIGTLWGPEALKKINFGEPPDGHQHSRFGLLLQAFRGT